MRGNLLCNTISNCLSPYPGWSSQSLWDHGVSQWEIKPSLNLAGAIPRMITDNLKLLSFNHILYIIIWVQLKSSIWSVGPVQAVHNPYPPPITTTCTIIMRSGNTNGGFYGVWIGLHLFNDDTCSPVHISCPVWSFLLQFVKSLFGT